MAIGTASSAQAKSSTAIGASATTTGERAIAIGNADMTLVSPEQVGGNFSTRYNDTLNTQANGKDSIALGTGAKAKAENAIAIGHKNDVAGKQAVGVGYNNQVKSDDSGVIGNNNVVNTAGTYVLGSGINKNASLGSTVANSVYLGDGSTIAAGSTVGVKNLLSNGSQGITTTAGDKGSVISATIGNLTYGNFAGAKADGVVSVGSAGKERRIQNVAAAEISSTSTDGVNGSQLYATNQVIHNLTNGIVDNFGGNAAVDSKGNITFTNIGNTNKNTIHEAIEYASQGFNITADHSNLANQQKSDNIKPGETVTFTDPDGNLVTTVSDNQIQLSLGHDIKLGKDGKDGKDGKIGVSGKDGAAVVLNGKDGSIGLTDPRGADGKDGVSANIHVKDGAKGLDGNDGADGESKTRIVYEKPDGTTEEIATLNDGLYFQGDKGEVIAKKLNEKLEIKGNLNTTAPVTDKNLRVDNENGVLVIKMAKALSDLTSATFGTSENNTVINQEGIVITNAGKGDVSLTNKGLDNGLNQIINVDSGLKDKNGETVSLAQATGDILTHAVNVGDLKNTQIGIVNTGFNIAADNGAADNVKLGETVTFTDPDGNLVTTMSDNQIQLSLGHDIKLGKDGKDGKDGKIGVSGKDGAAVVLNGKDGSIGLTGPRGADGKDGVSANIHVKDGAKGLDGNDGADGESKTRIVYEKPDGTTEEIATLNDGLRFVGNDGKEVIRKLNQTLHLTGGLDKETILDETKVSSANLGIRYKDKDGLELVMAERPIFSGVTVNGQDGKDAMLTFAKDGKDGMSLVGVRGQDGKDGLTLRGANGKDGVTFRDDGRITHVTDGKDDHDAVNLSQLKNVEAIANKGWHLTTNGKNSSEVQPDATVDFANKDGNIQITNTGNSVLVNLAKNIQVESVTTGDTKLSNNGITITNPEDSTKNVSLTKTGLNNGNNKITHVAAGEHDTDAVNLSQLKNSQNEATKAATWKLNTEGHEVAGKSAESISNQTVTVKHGVNTKVSEIKRDEQGNYSYEIDVTGLPMEYVDDKGNSLVNIGGQFYSQESGENGQLILTPATPAKVRITSDKPMQLTNIAAGRVSEDSTDAINGSQLHKVVTDGLTFTGDEGELKTPLGEKVTISGGVKDATKLTQNNIGVIVENGKLNVRLAKSLTDLTDAEFKDNQGNVTKIKGDGIHIEGNQGKAVSLTVNGLDNGGNRITNVAQGINGTDAVNVNQLKGAVNHLAGNINKVDRNARAGIAGAVATAGLPQAYLPGKSLFAVGAGTYRGETGLAIGLSSISDGGNWIIKGTANADSRGHFGASAAIGYQW